ncbi:cysteine peptidase family C39 domain-containing protein [uncultured Bacteroides sp.]|uniref:cysteine peptidase family C39 domain-containing protein n=1 Tax=uncultured Bacteroides sp. TaxID=162156 RepID=UPI00262DFD9D|nr:cysteine peptidase family C39 domain-containing protein [uncultured Bacteroides sp.]
MLRLFNIRYTTHYVKKLVQENSDGNNLLGIISILRMYGFVITPKRVDDACNIQNIRELLPFITEIEGDIVLMEKIQQNVILGKVGNKTISLNVDDFIVRWTKVVVSIRKGTFVEEPNFKEHKINDVFLRLSRVCMFVTLYIFMILGYVDGIYSFYTFSIFSLSILGAILSYQIEQSFYSTENLMYRLCALFKSSSCKNPSQNEVHYTSSLGFSYFCSLAIFTLFPFDNYIGMNIVIWGAGIEVLWSILYQIKQHRYCVQCILVQLIIVFTILLATFHEKKFVFNWEVIFDSIILFGLIFIIIYVMVCSNIWKQTMNKYKLQQSYRTMNSLKKQYLELINQILENSGNHANSEKTNNKDTIIFFLSPYCKACKDDFLESFNLLVNSKEPLITPIIITQDLNGDNTALAILADNKPNSIYLNLKEWYTTGYKNPDCFEKKHRKKILDEIAISRQLKNNLELAHIYNIQYTPSIVYNGIVLPSYVSLVDVLTQLD